MSVANIEEYLKLVPALRQSPNHLLWSSYDADADTLYINFKKPSHATDSELTDDDVIGALREWRSRRLDDPTRE